MSQSHESLNLAERIACLEASNRRLKRYGAVAALGLAVLVGAGADKGAMVRTGVIDAEGFRVVDGAGKVRASLGFTKTGSIALTLNNGHGVDRIQAGIVEGGAAALVFRDAGNVIRAQLSTAEREGGGMTFFDALGKGRVTLMARDDATAGLSLTDQRGVPRGEFRTDGRGVVEHLLRDGDEGLRIIATVMPDPRGNGTFAGLTFFDAATRARLVLGALPTGAGDLRVMDGSGAVLAKVPDR